MGRKVKENINYLGKTHEIISVWSKIESGGAPQPVTLVNLIREKLKQQSNRISDQVEMDLRDQL